jgi:hypothetical protein
VSLEGAGTIGPKGWAPTGTEVDHLAHLLHHSAVNLNVASTVSLDAAALDVPVINLSFDGERQLEWIRSVRRFHSFHHYRRLLAYGGIRVADSAEECAREVRAYLDDPGRDAEGRKRIVDGHCYRVDGQSARRIAEAVVGGR